MNILGLHCFGHHSGAAVVTPGQMFSISEERLSRIKNDGAFPILAIRYCLDAAGLTPEDIDTVVYNAGFGRFADHRVREGFERIFGPARDGLFEAVDHHVLHAWGAVAMSGFDEAAVMVLDGGGSLLQENYSLPKVANCAPSFRAVSETEKLSFFRFSQGKLTRLRTIGRPPGIASIYTNITQYLGFDKHDAGKTMGLASYARDRSFLSGDPLVRFLPEAVGDFDPHFHEYSHDVDILSILLDRPPRRADQPLPDEFYTEVAGAAQRACEHYVIEAARYLASCTGAAKLVLSGGVALNAQANSQLERAGFFEEIFAFPACSDTGIPIGGAIWKWISAGNDIARVNRSAPFFGKPYSVEEIDAAIARVQHKVSIETGDVAALVAQVLANGQCVGIFDGGSEIGPRALGHRSILANATSEAVRDRLNLRVKRREAWRPFGPAVLETAYSRYFCGSSRGKEYMIFTDQVRPEVRSDIAGAVHADGSARPQAVNARDHMFLHEILMNYDRLTGHSVLLNTSFNVAGEPIIETPDDGLACLFSSGLDFVAFPHALVRPLRGE